MTRILLSGAGGKMGRVIAAAAAQREDCVIVAGLEPMAENSSFSFPVFSAPTQCTVAADVIVDFSHPSCFEPLLQYAIGHSLPAVIATTGLSQEQVEAIHQASRKIPIFFSANMSLGVSLLAELAKKAAAVLGGQFDIEIIEKHHNQKLDAPSGTALLLADAISSQLKNPPRYEYDRHSKRAKRGKNEIGIHSVRGGTIVGEHQVLFAGRDEVITLSHTAMSKEVFATGGINAALFLANRQPGLYNMGNLI